MSDLRCLGHDLSADVFDHVRTRTPARLLEGRVGVSYRTGTQLRLRVDHAFARDAVHAELSQDFLTWNQLIETSTRACSRREYLLRPDLGRHLDEPSRSRVAGLPRGVDVQFVVGDGLSASAVEMQAPILLPLLVASARSRGWSFGTPFAVRQCRVGILNEIGELLDPQVVVLLIGERPGLATAASLSAYMAYRPRPGHTDAARNLVSNIHDGGVRHVDAVRRIMSLADTMRRFRASGISVKEVIDAAIPSAEGPSRLK